MCVVARFIAPRGGVRRVGFDFDATPTSVRFELWLKLFDYFKRVGDEHAMQMIAGSEKRLRRQQAGLEKIHRTRVLRI